MAVVTFNSTIESIVSEVQKLSTLEQKEILTQIRIMKLKNKLPASLSKPPKGLKPLTMAQIDKIKHESRKSDAGK
jgi:hypothetical protein